MSNALAITGWGAISAAGATASTLRAAFNTGESCLRRAHVIELPLAAHHAVGLVTAPVPDGHPRTVALALAASREALAHAGLPRAARASIGLALGSCTGGMREGGTAYFADQAHFSPAYRQQPIGRSALRLAQSLALHGPLTAHAEACASAACALVEAALWIEHGLAPAVVVVGADALTRLTMAGFTSLQVVDPAGCRPFIHERAGMSLGEGACALVLENAAHARARGAPIHAWLRGWALSADGHHPTAPDPSGHWLEHAARAALAQAQLAPAQLDLVAAHGTGTHDNDRSEAAVLARLHPRLVVHAHKGVIGHTLGAAATFGVAAALCAFSEQAQLPNVGAATGTALPGVLVPAVRRPAHIANALVTCLAFGGANAALVLSREDR